MTGLIRRFMNMEPVRRVRITSTVSMIYNVVSGGSKIFFGILSSFFFLCVSGAYVVCIGMGKRIYFRGRAASGGEPNKELKYYREIGILLLIAALFYIAFTLQYVLFPSELRRYGTLTSVALCVISLVEITLAVTGILRARRDRDLLMEGLKFINLATSFAAAVTAEAVLLTWLGAENAPFVNGVFGLLLGVASAGTGIYMMCKAAALRRGCRLMCPEFLDGREQCGKSK